MITKINKFKKHIKENNNLSDSDNFIIRFYADSYQYKDEIKFSGTLGEAKEKAKAVLLKDVNGVPKKTETLWCTFSIYNDKSRGDLFDHRIKLDVNTKTFESVQPGVISKSIIDEFVDLLPEPDSEEYFNFTYGDLADRIEWNYSLDNDRIKNIYSHLIQNSEQLMFTEPIKEEVKNGNFYFYHSTKNLQAALYIIKKQWRTSMGLYGNGIYGQQFADPVGPENNLSSSTISRYKDMYGGSYRFKIKYDNPEDLFYLDIDAGKEVYPNYSVSKAIKILEKHNVPQHIINDIKPYFSTRTKVPALSYSIFATDKVDGGLLGKYGFKGLVYQGNQDGSCVVFWYPNNADLDVVEYSKDFGKTWTQYDSSNKIQVKELTAEIEEKIKQLDPVLSNRATAKAQTGKRPPLDIKGVDRDWIRIIECGDKAGYSFKNGDYTSGNINQFASLVQRQINASKEPKRTNRYNIAIKLLPEVQTLINI